jgi:N-acetylmuramoyl-L-alanine amidase
MRVWHINPLIWNDRSGFFNWVGCGLGLLAMIVAIPVQANGRRPAPIVHEADIAGRSCLSLEDVAQIMNGHLHWYPVSQRVDLSFPFHEIQFYLGSTKVVADGKPAVLDSPATKDEQGLWVEKSFFQTGPLANEFARRIDLGPVETVKSPGVIAKPIPPVVLKNKTSKIPPPALPGVSSETVKSEPAEVAEPEEGEPATTAEGSEPVSLPHVIRRIVIDPGHGGKDPGAVGVHGTEEKSVNLWMAQELADALREKDFEVLLTRTDDSFIPLSQRAALANKYKADLFISLHCNASLSSHLNGFEVYFLSEKASDPHADAVARWENASLQFEGKTSPPSSVQAVLRSLEKNTYINHAAQLGAIIDREVARQMSQADLGVKQAAFYVLRGAEMPAILIEIGFLTNKSEEHLLESKAYRRRLIKAMEAGILEYDQKQLGSQKKRAG